LILRGDTLSFSAGLPVAALFLISAVAKSQSIHEFEATLVKSEFVSATYAPLTSYLIVACEACLAIGLLLPRLRGKAATMAIPLVSGYISYALWRLIRGISVPCVCFGTLFQLSPPQIIAVNVCLLVLLAIVLRIEGATMFVVRQAEGRATS